MPRAARHTHSKENGRLGKADRHPRVNRKIDAIIAVDAAILRPFRVI